MVMQIKLIVVVVVTEGYNWLQGVTGGLQVIKKRLQGVTRGYRGLQGVTRGYRELQGVTKGHTGLEGLQGFTRGYKELKGFKRVTF